MNYYPDRIADDDEGDDNISCCSADIEGGVAVASGAATSQHNQAAAVDHHVENTATSSIGDNRHLSSSTPLKSRPWKSQDDDHDEEFDENDDCALEISRHGSSLSTSKKEANNHRSSTDGDTTQMAAMIQNERNRRLGVYSTTDAQYSGTTNNNTATSSSSDKIPSAPNSGPGFLGNIKGWLGGGRGAAATAGESSRSRRSRSPTVQATPSHKRSDDNMNTSTHSTLNNTIDEKTDDSSTTSSDGSSSESGNDSQSETEGEFANEEMDLTPHERARIRALRYLSNACVDAGRKAKTASYIRGLERLDLKRRRDRFERELEVVETEMNKDRGVPEMGARKEVDRVSEVAAKLVEELPRTQALSRGSAGADAGAGVERGKHQSAHRQYMNLEEYADALHAFDSSGVLFDDESHPSSGMWEDKAALELYSSSLQSRLKDAMDRTRSLEKRLVVLERTGDEIVSSLCEDLVEVTGHSNKAEARYVKKGKELQRKRRREEVRLRNKERQAERRVRKLEERLLPISGEAGSQFNHKDFADSDSSDENTTDEDDEEEDDEIRLEKKLASIKSKNEQEKAAHESEVDSIRRQCEQFKLRLSVVRLVMAGDDNLRDYIAILDRLNPSVQHQRHLKGHGESYHDFEMSGISINAIPPPPPSRITRARAKLLKATHLEWIYEQRLAVSKAFTDAAINALEQELSEREEAGQKMEVRCLNELMAIDSEMKHLIARSDEKLAELQTEARELEDAIAAVSPDVKGVDDDDSEVCCVTETKTPTTATEVALPSDKDSSDTTSSSDEDTNKGRHKYPISGTDDDSSHYETSTPNKVTPKMNAVDVLLGDEPREKHGESSRGDVTPEVMKDIDEVPTDKSVGESGDAVTAAEHNKISSVAGTAKEQPSKNEASSTESKHSEDQNITEAMPPSDVSNDDRLKCDDKNEDRNAAIAYSSESAQANADSSNPKRQSMLEFLGRELNCTLAEYQTAFDLSSSKERVEQLEYMNDIVVKIAKINGVDLNQTQSGENAVKSWSARKSKSRRKRSERKSSDRKKSERKRSDHKSSSERNSKTRSERRSSSDRDRREKKKTSSKRRRHRAKERSDANGKNESNANETPHSISVVW